MIGHLLRVNAQIRKFYYVNASRYLSVVAEVSLICNLIIKGSPGFCEGIATLYSFRVVSTTFSSCPSDKAAFSILCLSEPLHQGNPNRDN